jgi:hypothetical protein
MWRLAVRVACAGVIAEVAESAKRKSPAVARRDLGETRARPAVLVIAKDMAAAQAYSAKSVRVKRTIVWWCSICATHNSTAVPLRQRR